MRRADDFLCVILAGPSGTGKTTITSRLLEEMPDELALSISYTTRNPRGAEVDGRHYHFVDRARFTSMVQAGVFLEWAEVHGNLYGTSAEKVDAARATHRGMLFDIDYQGARQIRAAYPGEVVGVFLLPPSMAELERRLRARGTDNDEVIARRMQKARAEIEQYGLFDYVVVNDALERAYDEVKAIVTAERARRDRRAPIVENVLRNGSARGPGAR